MMPNDIGVLMTRRNITLVVMLVSITALLSSCVNLPLNTGNTNQNSPYNNGVNTNESNSNTEELVVPTETKIIGGEIVEIDYDDLFTPFWESWEALHEYYVDQPIDNQQFADGATSGLKMALSFQGIDTTNFIPPENAITPEEFSKKAKTPRKVRDEFSEFWNLWQLAVYASQGDQITFEYLMQSALTSLVDSLGDQHTAYMDPYQYNQSQISLNGEYEGIGAWVDTSTEYLTIISPMENSPAEKAGLLSGDRIIAIDGEDMTGIDGNLVIRRVLGPAGSLVVLTIERDGVDEPFDVEIIRAQIVIPNIDTEILDGNIGYIQLQTFGANSSIEFRDALEEILEANPIGIIFDLRNNGGGYLDVSIKISSEFISDGVVLYEEFGDGSRLTHNAYSGGLATEIPLVILVNEGSASASEIVAGAIQDSGRGILIGTTTFGKGSVQRQIVLNNNQGALRITIARWLTPNENLIHEIGIEPDYYIEISQEDIDDDLDPQLEKAIELLSSP